MPKTITITQADFDKRTKEVAYKSFMLGVDWMCKILVESDIWEFSQSEADMFHKRADSIFPK